MRETPRNLMEELHTLGSNVARTPLERQMLAIIENTIASFVQRSIRLPWHPPAQFFDQLGSRQQTAAAWAAIERLWFFFCVEGLVADPLRAQARKRLRAVQFEPDHWVAASRAAALAQRLFELPKVFGASTEEWYVAEAVYLLSCSCSPPGLLDSLSRTQSSDVDWERGVIWLTRQSGGGSSISRVPYTVELISRLALGRLELYVRAHPAIRCEPMLLPDRWRQSGALARLMTRWSRKLGEASGIRDHLIAARYIPLLQGPALFAAVRAGLPAGWQRDPVMPVLEPSVDQEGAPIAEPRASLIQAPAVLGQVRWLLRRIEPRMSKLERDGLAQQLEVLIPDLGGAQDPLANDALITAWAVALLRNARLRPNTVLTWLTGLYTALAESLTASILTLSAEELHELASALIANAECPNSRAVMKQRLKRFCSFLRERYELPAVTWRSPELTVGTAGTPIVLVDPYAAEQAVGMLPGYCPNVARALNVAICLAFWCGLRASEIAMLQIDDLLGGRWGLICIRDSKTSASKRIDPGALLTPEMIWTMIMAYVHDRRQAAGTGRAPLLITAEGKPWTAKALGKQISTVLHQIAGCSGSLHALRRGCATYTLIAWGVARGLARWPIMGGEWGEMAVAPSRLSGLLEALGSDESLVLPRLSQLLGHAECGVTISHYLAMDLIQQTWISPAETLVLSANAATDLLQVSRIALYKRLRPIDRGGFNAEQVLRVQVERIKGSRRCRGAEKGKRQL